MRGALISHHLVYKDEFSVPQRMRRDLNNVASLLEVAQGVFDSVREKRATYLDDIQEKKEDTSRFLAQPIDYDTLFAYTQWKYPDLEVSERWHPRLLRDLNLEKYRTLVDIDAVVNDAKPAVEAYQKENPSWFPNDTAYITKSLGFMDSQFRRKHAWGQLTKDAFKKFGHLVKPTMEAEQAKSSVRGKSRR
jgi:putative GTP pyrophosphokinase